jgi:hypothetical protein
MKEDTMKEDSQKVKEFKFAVKALCKQHNLSISHEDGYGAFLIEPFDEYNIKWFEYNR